MVACLNPELRNVAKTLIELGANVNAYRPGKPSYPRTLLSFADCNYCFVSFCNLNHIVNRFWQYHAPVFLIVFV